MRIKQPWVPFLFLVGCCLLIAAMSHSEDFWVNRSTNITGEATLFKVPESYPGDYLGLTLINLRASSGTLTIYDSSATATSSFGPIQLSSDIPNGRSLEGYGHQNIYMIRLSSGLTYSKSGFGDVTLFWRQKRSQ